MVILDGRTLAQKIIAGLKAEIGERELLLAAVVIGEDPVIAKFVTQKKKIADELGVAFRVYDYPATISTNDLRKRLATIVHDADPTGIIIQLPLPAHINTQYILNSVPPEKDVDVLSARAVGDFSVGKSKVLPPVVAAVKALFDEYGIDYRSKYIVVVGAGTLVGKPVAIWLTNEKASFTVVDPVRGKPRRDVGAAAPRARASNGVDENTPDISESTQRADILITGVGKPGLITGDMIKDGAVVIDAGTSVGHQPPATSHQPGAGSRKLGAVLAGDVDFDSVSRKASHLTPVPGGVGPLTVAMIYRNLVTLGARLR